MAFLQAGRALNARGDMQPSCTHMRSCSHQVPSNATVRRRGPPAAAAAPPYKSFDAEDELDKDLAEELSRFKSPDAWDSMAKHLDLVWKIGRGRGKRQVCNCCQGSGQCECKWCNGTGAMMVGDTLFRGPDGSSHCPVCKGKGELACEHCRGTGHLARWMQGPDTCST